MFEKDISNLAKPEIKGRGFLQSGNDIIETQTYFTKPENDWVFDETLKLTYDNPVFLEQKKLRNEEVDDTGWVEQSPIVEVKEEVKPSETVDEKDDEWYDDDIDYEEEEFESFPSKLNSEIEIPPKFGVKKDESPLNVKIPVKETVEVKEEPVKLKEEPLEQPVPQIVQQKLITPNSKKFKLPKPE